MIIGIEACGYTNWFEELVEGLGHKLLVGDAAEIRRLARRRQKNDRRDANLLLELLLHNEFPALFRYPPESREVLRQLRYKHKLVKLRTMVANTLHALPINAGLSLRAQLLTRRGRKQLGDLRLSVISEQQRDELLSLADELSRRIVKVEQGCTQAKSDARVRRLQTHPGVGLLTSLCLVHTLGELNRFSSTRKVAAYVGFDPVEHSSAERKVYGGISKAGSRLLRYLLVEAGQTACKHDEQLQQFYRRLVPRRGKPRAKVAVARKLLICGARSASKLKERSYLRSMLSRRQLQGFVIPPRIVAGFQLPALERGSAALFKSFKSKSTRPAPRRALYQALQSRAALTGFQIKGRGITPELSGCPRTAFNLHRRKIDERHSVGQSARMTC